MTPYQWAKELEERLSRQELGAALFVYESVIADAIAETKEKAARIVDDADSGRILPAQGVAQAIREMP